MNLEHLEFDCNLHYFSACKLKSARTIWINQHYFSETRQNGAGADAFQKFADRFAYMIPDGQIFENLEFDRLDARRMGAERYGGAGIERNGGGARCGNIGRFQIKGNGKNQLAGKHTGLHHSYGGYRAVYAIHEAVYSHMLDRIMPGGAAKVYGVMLTGPDAAFQVTTARGWGALLVREFVVRPANFLRAGFFSHADAAASNMMSDVARVRLANRMLMERLGLKGFLHLLDTFLRNSANQFAFARLARLTHGAVTPSNMCFDGRWIDLTNTSFVNASDNIMGGNIATPSFYEEMYAPVSVMKECVDTFAKYNDIEIDVRPMSQHYGSLTGAYMKQHLAYLFGLRYANLDAEACDAALGQLRSETLYLLSQGQTVHHVWPEKLPASDPVLCLLEFLFTARADMALARGLLEKSTTQPRNPSLLLQAFSTVIDTAFAKSTKPPVDHPSFLALTFVTAFKRAYLPAVLYKARLEKLVLGQLQSGDPDTVGCLMTALIDFVDWAFPLHEAADIILFSSPDRRISLNSIDGHFSVHEFESGEERRFMLARELMDYLDSNAAASFHVFQFDFGPYLRRLLTVLAAIDGSPRNRRV